MTPSTNRLGLALKIASQLGITPVVLYGLYRLGLRSGHYRRMDPRMHREAQRAARPPLPVFALPEPALLARRLSRQARLSLSRDANAVVAGQVRLFGHRMVPLHLVPGRRLHHWTAYENDPSLLSPFLDDRLDIKFIWEPLRFGWAYALARAFHLSRNEKYAHAFWTCFERFDRGNPAYLGPHWINGQELALRLMALIWCAQVFGGARASTPKRLSRLGLSIAQHAARIPPTLVYARSQNNNHLVTECTALYLAGSALDHAPWRKLGWRWLNRALEQQIAPDGEYIQHSANYHRLMLDSVLLADAARRTRGEHWPAITRLALSRASHWLFSMIDPTSGKAPNLGANDGARILPLASSSFDDYRPTVQAVSRAFLRTGLPGGDWDELSLWLGLPESGRTAGSAAYAAEHLRGRDSWSYLRVSASESRLSHMDQLHLDLWWRGHNVAADAGTYLYNAPPPWDNPLVTSRVHNLVTIDGREQMTRAGRFLVLDWFPGHSRHVLAVEPPVQGRILSSHAGYKRLGIRHERLVSSLAGDRWLVHDDLLFNRPAGHVARLHWLLCDGEWRLRQRGVETRLRLRSPVGWLTVVITAIGFDELPRLTLVRAGRILRGEARAFPYEGWISPTYGWKVPALSLALEAVASHGCSFTTEFRLPG